MNNRNERERSDAHWGAIEANTQAVVPLDPAETRRYADPPEDTPFALEYAFHLLGNVAGRRFLT